MKIPQYLPTRLLSILQPTPIEIVTEPAEVVFTREDPVGRVYTIYAMRMKRAPGWKQWGAPAPVLEDNMRDVDKWARDQMATAGIGREVAPFTGARIETMKKDRNTSRIASEESPGTFPGTEQAMALREFQAYVKSGFYSKWYRDKVASVGEAEARRLSILIREAHIENAARDLPQFGGMTLAGDGSTVVVGVPALLEDAVSGFERLMVGNHGVYVEFSPPDGVTVGNFVKKRLQYNEYRQDGMKLYQQFAKVNYADYVPGKWYVSLYEKNLFSGSLLISRTESEGPCCRQIG